MTLTFDHLAVSARTVDEGVAWVEAALGVPMAGGGQHPKVGTHNRLLGLGDVYLEVIAADPAIPKIARARLFDLDHFSGPPRLTNWVARCDDLATALAASPAGTGAPVALARGDFQWEMSVPDAGKLPFDGGFPALIQWYGDLHPTQRLPDAGVRLMRFEIAHPAANALRKALAGRCDDARVIFTAGPGFAMRAEFETPHGLRVLG